MKERERENNVFTDPFQSRSSGTKGCEKLEGLGGWTGVDILLEYKHVPKSTWTRGGGVTFERKVQEIK